IYNLCTLGTIEEHIVNLLHEKINLFELVIGELDEILEKFEKQEQSLEKQIAKAMLESSGNRELSSRFQQLGHSLSHVREEQRYESNRRNDQAFKPLLDSVSQPVEVKP